MPIVLKSGSLNLLENSAPVQACNGIALPLPLIIIIIIIIIIMLNMGNNITCSTNCNYRITATLYTL